MRLYIQWTWPVVYAHWISIQPQPFFGYHCVVYSAWIFKSSQRYYRAFLKSRFSRRTPSESISWVFHLCSCLLEHTHYDIKWLAPNKTRNALLDKYVRLYTVCTIRHAKLLYPTTKRNLREVTPVKVIWVCKPFRASIRSIPMATVLARYQQKILAHHRT